MMNSLKRTGSHQHRVDIILNVTLGLMLLGSMVTIFWGADRSLGLADEGLYLLAARYPDEIQQNVSSVYVYTGYLFRMVGFNPTAFRLLGVILICISAFIFWLGFCKFLSKLYPKSGAARYFQLYSLLFIEMGALLQYQWFYLTPSYNTLISVAINIFAGSLLYGLSQIGYWQERLKTIACTFVIGGASIGLALFTKFPAGICLFLVCILTIISWRGIEIHKKVKLTIAASIGIFAWFAGHFLLVQPLQIWWAMFKEGWSLYQAFGAHSPENKSIVYLSDLTIFAYSAIKIYWPCYLIVLTAYLFFILRRGDKNLSEEKNSVLILIVILIAVLLSAKAGVFIDDRKLTDGSAPFYLLFHFAWILLLLTIWILNAYYKKVCFGENQLVNVNVNDMIVLVLLVALPVAGSVGTSNPLYSVPLCYAATWFGAILLLVVTSSFGERHGPKLKMIIILAIGAFTTSQVIQGYIFDPQGIARNLLQQIAKTTIGFPTASLKVDSPTQQLVEELSSMAKANGFQPGDDIIAFSYIPGLVYAMGGRSPGHPAFLSGPLGLIDKEHVEEYSRLALHFADIQRLRNALILLDVDPGDVKSLLASRGLDFPNGYIKLGVTVCSGVDFSLWKPANSTNIDLPRR